MQDQDRGYFVRLDAAPAEIAYERSRRRDHRHHPHRRSSLRPLHVVGLVVGGWLAWAATTPGGVDARVRGASDAVRELLWDATTDPGLRRAANYYNDRYSAQAAYPRLSDEQIRSDPAADWGIGVDVEWCNNQAIVLQSLTGHGTISRLLVNGQDLGDVEGEVGCPGDLANPLPWRYNGDD
ncbi:MAG: hypothetical protein ACT4OX_07120 [Actinomycetota bacterium]